MGATMKPSNKESVQDTVARLRENRNQQQSKVGKNATHSSKEQTPLILQRDRKPQKRQSSKCSRAQNRGKQNHQTLIAWRANTGPSAEKSTH